jgi:ribonuclease HI
MSIILPKIKTNKNKVSKVFPMTEFTLKFDGCSKGNPGRAGIGAVIYKNGLEYWASCKYIGDKKTNNESEYSALIFGLEAAIEKNIHKLSVYGDSLLVINQVNGIYKVKNENLFELYEKAIKLKNQFSYIDFNHIYRKDNKRADELSNIALKYIDNNIDNKIYK